MVAAGNIKDSQELATVIELVVENLDYYLNNIGESTANDYTDAHNWYCSNQKQNPHTPRVMEALGLNAEKVKLFIRECLFPEIPYANVGSKQIEGCHG